MPIQWVNAKDIMRIHNEVNTDHPLIYPKAIEIKKKCIELYEQEHGPVELFNKDLIPLDWYENYFGKGLLIKNKKSTSS
ncbi:MAG: hypothetical protein U0N20_06745 [Clostridium sp.]